MGSLLAQRHDNRRRLRVLAVVDSLEVGGAQHHLLALAQRMVRNGDEFLVATSANEPMAADFRDLNVPVRSLAASSIKHRLSPVFAGRLMRLAARGGYDLIHAHLFASSVAACIAARVTKLPLVVTHHSMSTWQHGWERRLSNWVDRSADAVIAVSSNIAATRRVPVRIIPNGVEIPDQRWTAHEIATARTKLGVPIDAFTVSFVGRFTEDKNPLLYVEMAALVGAQAPDAHFLLIGDGPLRNAAERRAAELGIGARMTFAGFQPDAGRLHQIADALAVTSASEGSPLVVLEAMAAGRPVVATNVGDISHQIADGETGYLVQPGDPDGLARALLALRDRSRWMNMGAAGRDRVLRFFPIQRTLQETLAVYRDVLQRGKLRTAA
jgi:glycosyltransferase involved in cell wall biosynthesis